MDEHAADQLSSLGRVGRLLGDAGIAYWLYGGWAVDFYAGEATRPHDDVDLALRDGPAVWSPDAFAGDARELNGVRSTVMGLETLTGMKRYARGDPEDMAKDRADLEHLARLSR